MIYVDMQCFSSGIPAPQLVSREPLEPLGKASAARGEVGESLVKSHGFVS
jgi:hypothetical protein